MISRYDTDHITEAQFEQGSHGRVLKNLLGMRSKRAMDEMEASKLVVATDWAIRHVTAEQRFTAADICLWHKQWLGELYPWAGEYRRVNIGKGGFMFAMSAHHKGDGFIYTPPPDANSDRKLDSVQYK